MKSLPISVILPLFFTLSAFAENTAPLGAYTAVERRHWAFQPRTRPEIPLFTLAADKAWVRNPIDAFVLSKMKAEGLQPAPEADRRTLIRRAFTLRGLPPSPEEIEAFVNDKSPQAWDKVIDRYLASPRYAERWAQHWLDVVRFSESDGFEYDTHRNGAWRFRDYVIQSIQADKPYDRFVMEQLAGDELDGADPSLRAAAGLQRMGPLRKNVGNQEVASSRNEVLTEMTNIVGAAFLGVTLGCARCHDHKFDALRQSDYYRIQSYFAATHEKDVVLASEEEQKAWNQKAQSVQAEIKALRASLRGKAGEERVEIEKKLEEANDRLPAALPALFTVENDFKRTTPIHLLDRGEYTKPKDKVGARPLGVLLPEGTPEREALPENPRSKLAEWIVNPDNPLTARVMANRVWHWYFGRGIVATPNDFGKMGMRPTHPELLDWFANQFVENGWKLRPLHKLLLTSSTWKQAYDSPVFAAAMEKDPENKYLWHWNRRRLEAEELRDSMLAVSGRLNTRMGGESIIVPVDKELIDLLYKPSQWTVNPDRSEHDRRSVYLIAKRNLRLPMMEAFDAPDLQISCARRESSTHAPQALEMMNGDFANSIAASFAERLEKESGGDPARMVARAWELTAGRAPTHKERGVALQYLAANKPLREFALAVLNMNSFLYVE
jgi:hypothetical protein